MFFEGIRSERQLLRLAADRLSVRWYLGFNLDEPLPDHSSLTRIRTRYGLETFRRFFDTIVAQCQRAGLVWGKELYIDATQVQASAAMDSLTARFAVEAREARAARGALRAQQAKQAMEALVTAAAQNLKRLLAKQGWGRRPLPSGGTLAVKPSHEAFAWIVESAIPAEVCRGSVATVPETNQLALAA